MVTRVTDRGAYYSAGMLCALMVVGAVLSGCHGSDSLRDQGEARIPESGCPDVSGTYRLYGEPLPGMPPYFRFRNLKLPLDSMLGLDLNVPEGEQLTTVELRQSTTFEVIARGGFGVLSRKSEWAPGDRVICESGTLVIYRTRKISAEGTTETMDSIDTLSLADDGALLIRVEINTWARWLFIPFPWPLHEEYGARFKRA